MFVRKSPKFNLYVAPRWQLDDGRCCGVCSLPLHAPPRSSCEFSAASCSSRLLVAANEESGQPVAEVDERRAAGIAADVATRGTARAGAQVEVIPAPVGRRATHAQAALLAGHIVVISMFGVALCRRT